MEPVECDGLALSLWSLLTGIVIAVGAMYGLLGACRLDADAWSSVFARGESFGRGVARATATVHGLVRD